MPLLDGSMHCGKVAAAVLSELVSENELPELFDELCSSFAISSNVLTRSNTAFALQLLCKTHSVHLQGLVDTGMKLQY